MPGQFAPKSFRPRSAEEEDRVELVAKWLGLTVSEMCRTVVLEFCERVAREVGDLEGDVKRADLEQQRRQKLASDLAAAATR